MTVISDDVLPRVTIDGPSVREYWKLMCDLCANEAHLKLQDDAYFASAIAEWEAYALKAAEAVAAGLQFPAVPSLRVWHCWLIHMLQPAAYRQDCLESFGLVLPHDINTLHLSSEDDVNHGKEWQNTDRRFQHVRWANGVETVSILLEEARKAGVANMLEDSSAPLEPALRDYRRYLWASAAYKKEQKKTGLDQSNAPSLSPTVQIDVVWHAHQCNPVLYAADLQHAGLEFINHEPCGALNPPDVAWQHNTRDAWMELFGQDIGSACFGGGMCNDDAFFSSFDEDAGKPARSCKNCSKLLFYDAAGRHVVSGSEGDWTDESRELCKSCWEEQKASESKPAAARAGPAGAPRGPAGAPRGPAGAPRGRGGSPAAKSKAKVDDDGTRDVTSQLERLGLLFEKGLLNEDEFKAAKAKILE
eukprot:TRINITY_DN2309_c0_g1_i1.p1 TRINITY_DN2309_c0_g1~~TRINITY_DN2309_c0_g1_i1.p1  ORF type:complete len:417 (-),score=74.39 TRINITY_DN2309_c0_g1_i1:37-1287(-)